MTERQRKQIDKLRYIAKWIQAIYAAAWFRMPRAFKPSFSSVFDSLTKTTSYFINEQDESLLYDDCGNQEILEEMFDNLTRLGNGVAGLVREHRALYKSAPIAEIPELVNKVVVFCSEVNDNDFMPWYA